MSELPPLNDLWMLILIAALVFIPIGMRLKAINCCPHPAPSGLVVHTPHSSPQQLI